ncbi:trimethylamine methyltransferase family protein [Fuchsiella alkaliacetigena]|uniref:trimethylamine methyltransferase family protein n=1 Tax=Fuchsiella alkaliacetigena TaxID=957042 RepID=UPI00200A8631|nr:trimethylamine methyltransferase family protein [Fuchsiella alkaliacetigena]MCK8825379.1 trimethylamine methyltransferase family protein [Fuchsiella alkaliacetigena]
MRPSLSFFSEEEIQQVHNLALEILESTGIRMPSQEAQDIFKEHGAEVEGDIVKISCELLDKALESVPKRDELILYGREEEYDINLSEDAPVLAGMVQATQILDLDDRQKRAATNEDVAKLMRMMNKLENISINSPLATPQDIPEDRIDWYTWATSIKNSKKHITGPAANAQCVKDAVEMASIAVGGKDKFLERPFFSIWVLTQPPLHIETETLSALMEASRFNIPAVTSSGPIIGVSSPVTIAGTTAQAHAEILSCLVLSQLVNPGAPIIYTSFARIMDMKVTNISMASPEFAIMKVCMAQLGHLLDLPTRMPSMLRDAKILDAQAGFETGMCGVLGALESDIIDGIQLDMDIVIDYADPIFCNEAMGQVRRVARGVKVDENTLAKDLIKEVGHGGDFMQTLHTAQNFKDELWDADLTERRMWEYWEEDGALDLEERAIARAREFIKEDNGFDLDKDLAAKIDEIAKKD